MFKHLFFLRRPIKDIITRKPDMPTQLFIFQTRLLNTRLKEGSYGYKIDKKDVK